MDRGFGSLELALWELGAQPFDFMEPELGARGQLSVSSLPLLEAVIILAGQDLEREMLKLGLLKS